MEGYIVADDLSVCENALVDEGYFVVRPDENIFVVEKFGKVWVIVTTDDVEIVRSKLAEINTEEEMRDAFYCEEATKL